MSASHSSKFQDHYALLGVDPRSAVEVIQAAYAKLAPKYRPDNPQTGDQAKFEAVNLAYEVLCDPALRAEFDKIKGIDLEDAVLTFAAVEFFDALGRQSGLRNALLCILYDRRRRKPYKPALSMRHVEGMLASTNDELNFALWYVKQRGLVSSDDKSNLQITVEGMDFLEHDRPAPEKVYPFIKTTALSVPAGPVPSVSALAAVLAPAALPAVEPNPLQPSPPPEPAEVEVESVSKFLNRALARR